MDHVWAMSRQQGLYVSHGLLGDVHVVVHVGERDSDDLPMGVGGSDGAAHSSPVLPGPARCGDSKKRVKRYYTGPKEGLKWHARTDLGIKGVKEWMNVFPAEGYKLLLVRPGCYITSSEAAGSAGG